MSKYSMRTAADQLADEVHRLNRELAQAERTIAAFEAPRLVRVTVYGGVVQDVAAPAGVRVQVYDYDVDGGDDGVTHDEAGEACTIATYGESA